MKCIAANTNVIVAGVLQHHPDHHRTSPWLDRARAGEIKLTVSTHTLAETYSILTKQVRGLALSPQQALMVIRDILGYVEPMDVLWDEYVLMIDLAAAKGLSGGVIYDAIHYVAAVKAKAEHLLTVNLRDFYRICTSPGFVLPPEGLSC